MLQQFDEGFGDVDACLIFAGLESGKGDDGLDTDC